MLHKLIENERADSTIRSKEKGFNDFLLSPTLGEVRCVTRHPGDLSVTYPRPHQDRGYVLFLLLLVAGA